ncbi:hypothetical protein D3C77_737590 [compost metagenome]
MNAATPSTSASLGEVSAICRPYQLLDKLARLVTQLISVSATTPPTGADATPVTRPRSAETSVPVPVLLA